MVHGPEGGLNPLAAHDADPPFAGPHRRDAVRAHQLERAGEHRNAIERYLAAANRTVSLPERDYLLAQAARLRDELGKKPG
jgi:predicted RNA polymerase sigma factor